MILVLGLSLIFMVGCFHKQNSNNDNLWDNMGGGLEGSNTDESKLSINDIILPTNVINLDVEKLDDSLDNAIAIDLDNLEMNKDYYTFQNDLLTITQAGIYELKGNLNGAILVNGDLDTTRIILNNVTISTKDNQSCAALTFSKTNHLRILTVYDNSVNVLKDSIGDDENGDGAVIYSKKSSLTMNGSGIIYLESLGTNTTCLKVKKFLDIIDTNINIKASNNGIKVDEGINIKNANIVITANGDGIKTDMAASSNEQAEEYAKNPYAGYIYINNSNLEITSGDDGISSNALLYIDNRRNDLIKIITNHGTPDMITETSSDNADGKALKGWWNYKSNRSNRVCCIIII